MYLDQAPTGWTRFERDINTIDISLLSMDEMDRFEEYSRNKLCQMMAAIIRGEISTKQANRISTLIGKLQRAIEVRRKDRQ